MQKHCFLLCCLMALQFLASAQSPTSDQTPKPANTKGLGDIYNLIEVAKPPFFPDGEKALLQFLAGNFHPDRKNNRECRLTLTFVVGIGGEISDIQIVQNTAGDCGQAAIKMVTSMPPWIPAELADGTPVKVRYSLPIRWLRDE